MRKNSKKNWVQNSIIINIVKEEKSWDFSSFIYVHKWFIGVLNYYSN